MSKYEGVDFYNLDQHLTEEELMVRDLVRDWVDEEVLPIIEDYYTKRYISFRANTKDW